MFPWFAVVSVWGLRTVDLNRLLTANRFLAHVTSGAEDDGKGAPRRLGMTNWQFTPRTRAPVLAALLALTAPLASGQRVTYEFVQAWGSPGAGDGQFKQPVSLALDAHDNVYVVDQGNSRIQKFTHDGAFLAAWGKPDRARAGYGGTGNTAGAFRVPCGIAVGPAGHVYVVEWGNHRVQKFTPAGQFVAKWGGRGAEDGLLSFPTGVGVDAGGTVYVADQDNARVQAYSGTGTYLTKVVKYGCRPCDVALSPGGTIVVAESRGRFWIFAADGSVIGWAGLGHDVGVPEVKRTGWFEQAQTYSLETGTGFWAEQGVGPGQFTDPRGLGVDAQGNVYVADSGNHRIQAFAPDGTLLAMWGSQGKEPGQFNWPYDVAVGRTGTVYVVDKYNHRVQTFAPRPGGGH